VVDKVEYRHVLFAGFFPASIRPSIHRLAAAELGLVPAGERTFPVSPIQGVFLMRKMTKKSKIVAVAAAIALTGVGGGAAFAYWTTTGSGSGSSANSLGGGTVALHATFAPGLAPGNSETVTYTADNASTTNTVVGALSATVTTSDSGCLPGWFTVTAGTTNSTVVAGTSGVSVGSGTLTFLDGAANQEACKGAVVTVSVTSN
jgi:hypothetical protein